MAGPVLMVRLLKSAVFVTVAEIVALHSVCQVVVHNALCFVMAFCNVEIEDNRYYSMGMSGNFRGLIARKPYVPHQNSPTSGVSTSP